MVGFDPGLRMVNVVADPARPELKGARRLGYIPTFMAHPDLFTVSGMKDDAFFMLTPDLHGVMAFKRPISSRSTLPG